MKERIKCLQLASMAKCLSAFLFCVVATLSHAKGEDLVAQDESLFSGQSISTPVLQDLIRAETMHALTQMQQGDQHRALTGNPLSTQVQRHEVHSIYGVGNRLFAELLLSSKPYVFLAGQSRPVSGSDRRWKLQRIQPPCVHLKHEDKPSVLCLGAAFE